MPLVKSKSNMQKAKEEFNEKLKQIEEEEEDKRLIDILKKKPITARLINSFKEKIEKLIKTMD